MRQIKDSGVEWIGNMPEHWEIIRGKYVLSCLNKAIREDDGVITCFRDGEVTLRSNRREEGFTMADKEIGYQGIDVGDLVVHGMDGFAGAIGISDSRGKASPVLNVLESSQNKQYIMYYLRSMAYNDVFTAIATGIRVRSCDLRWNKLAELPYPIPPIDEQNFIVDSINKQLHKSNEVISLIKKQIEMLEEYKRSVITEAVTKGLDPDVEMKDSGVEWIEDIPQGWEINRIKYLFSNGKGLPITKENLIDEGLPVISYGQIHAKFNTGVDISSDLIRFVSHNYERLFPQCEVCQYDFVFADTSEDYDGCGNCIYKRDDSLLYAGYHTIILHSLKRNDNRYFAYLFQTDLWRKQIRCAVSGVKVFSITQKIIMNAQIIIPSPKEQQHIANYLDRKCDEIDSIIKEKQQQLETLAEYKKSLIYEYVTGKKEVI